jgi:hypothetical protein
LDEIDIYCVFPIQIETPSGILTPADSRRDLHQRSTPPAPSYVGKMADRQDSRRESLANNARLIFKRLTEMKIGEELLKTKKDLLMKILYNRKANLAWNFTYYKMVRLEVILL